MHVHVMAGPCASTKFKPRNAYKITHLQLQKLNHSKISPEWYTLAAYLATA